MSKLKPALAFIFYFPSCMTLVGTHVLLSATLQSYGPGYIATFGERIASTTPASLSILSNSALICFGAVLVSLLGVITSVTVVKSSEAKCFWVVVIACCNHAVSVGLLSAMVSGFFLLPKLINES